MKNVKKFIQLIARLCICTSVSAQTKTPAFPEAQKAALLKELNQKLKKNAVNKEKTRLHAQFFSWRESAPKSKAEENVEAKWVNLTEDSVLLKNP